MAPHRALLIALSLLATPLAAQQVGGPVSVEWLVAEAERAVQLPPTESAEAVLGLWAWRRATDARDTCLIGARLASTIEATALLHALADAPAIPPIRPGRTDAELLALLEAPREEPLLATCLRAVRFTRGLDLRPELTRTLERLAAARPGHAWLAGLQVQIERDAPLVLDIQRMFEALALPIDPARSPRVRLERTGWDTEEAWLIGATAGEATFLDDALRVRTVSLGEGAWALAEADVEQELAAWAASGPYTTCAPSEPLAHATAGAVAYRAWWAHRLGRSWTALRLVRNAVGGPFTRSAWPLLPAARDLAGAVEQEAFLRLAAGRPRPEVAALLHRAARILEERIEPPEERRPYDDEGALLAGLTDLATRLEAQDAAARTAPPFPRWAEWEAMSAAERVPHLLRALPDLDGDGSDVIGFGGGSPWRALQSLPPDAPPLPPPEQRSGGFCLRAGSRRSATDWLVECGEAAVPALLEALGDRSPTRSVSMDDETPCGMLTVGQCAEQILEEITGDDLSCERSQAADDEARHAACGHACHPGARTLWAEWSTHGGLVAFHLTRLLEAERTPGGADSQRRREHVGWLLEHGRGRELETLRALFLGAPRDRRAEWIELLARSGGHEYQALVGRELDSPDPETALAAAAALFDHGDRRGVPRAVAILAKAVDANATIRAGVSEDAVGRAVWLLRCAEAPELPPLLLRLAAVRPESRDAIPSVEAPESQLARTRLDTLVPGNDPDRLLGELIAACAPDPRPELLEHAAVTACALGRLAELGAALGKDLRPSLLAALGCEDSALRAAAGHSIEGLGWTGLAWLAQAMPGLLEPTRTRATDELLAARVRLSLRVTTLEVEHSLPYEVHATLQAWEGRPLDLDEVSDVLEAWERADMPAFELVIARTADGAGVTVEARCPPRTADQEGWRFACAVDAAGITRRKDDHDERPPSDRVDRQLVLVQDALDARPEARARIAIRGER